MKRAIRILKILFKGKLNLAEKIHIRIWRELLYTRIINSINLSQHKNISAKEFNEMMNKAQLDYFNDLKK